MQEKQMEDQNDKMSLNRPCLGRQTKIFCKHKFRINKKTRKLSSIKALQSKNKFDLSLTIVLLPSSNISLHCFWTLSTVSARSKSDLLPVFVELFAANRTLLIRLSSCFNLWILLGWFINIVNDFFVYYHFLL